MLGTQLLGGMYLGDDAVNVWSRTPSVKEVTAAALDLGLVQHPDKQFVAEGELHYLQNYYSHSYIQGRSALGVRPLMRTLSPLLSYENFRNDDVCRSSWLRHEQWRSWKTIAITPMDGSSFASSWRGTRLYARTTRWRSSVWQVA